MKQSDKMKLIESMLDFSIEHTKNSYNSWDKSDCSLIGLIEILLIQEINLHKLENGDYSDSDYDEIQVRQKYK